MRRHFKLAGLLAAPLIGLGMGSASALAATSVQWNPQNTVEPATLASGSSLVLKDNAGNTVTCNTVNSNVEAPTNGNPAVAGTVNSSGAAAPPQFTNCTSTLGSASVTNSGQWLFTATSTSSVDASQATSKITIAGGLCTMSVSNAAVSGNSWSNTSHQLTLNNTKSFPITESGICDGATSATMQGTLQLPSTVTIS